jgi:hypothetical protein
MEQKGSFVHQRAHYQLPTSVVGMVEMPTQTRLEIRYGLHDQMVAEKLYQLHRTSPGLFESGTESFSKVYDAVARLRSPTIYKKEKSGDLEGLVVDDAGSLNAVLRTVENFALVVLENVEVQHSGNITLYNGIDVVFKKVKHDTPPKLP